MTAPNSSTDFNFAYRSSIKHWIWSDIRIPRELKHFMREMSPKRALELGCGIGLFSDYFAKEGIQMTAVDFSSVAIEKARQRIRKGYLSPKFLVSDVTNLDEITDEFEVSFDIGCFHCLDQEGRKRYAAEVSRTLKSGGRHLLWAMDFPPSDLPLSPHIIEEIFGSNFDIVNAQKRRRRLAHSHWYTLINR